MKYYENIEKKPQLLLHSEVNLLGIEKIRKVNLLSINLSCQLGLFAKTAVLFASLRFQAFGPNLQAGVWHAFRAFLSPKKSFPTAVERHSNLIQIS